jgi:HK97 family phage prohead protease
MYQHAWGEPPIGHVLEASEDGDGLVVRATLYHDDDPLAAKVLRGLRKKSLSEFSFAFEVKQAALVFEGDEVVRELRTVDLIECGPCLRGVNPETELLAVKSRLLGRKSGRALSAKTLEKLRGIASELVAFCDEHEPPLPTPDAGATEKAARAARDDWLLRRRLSALSLTH